MDFDHVAAAWGRWGPARERGSLPVSRRLIELANIGPGSTVLDIGTGIGEPAIGAARAVAPGGRVIAIDNSPAMLALARERAQRESVANVEFVEADGAAFRGESKFDAILSRWGLMFLPNLSASLAHYRTLLRGGGRFTAATWGAPPEVPLISLPMALATRIFSLEPPLLHGGPFALHDAAALAERFVASGYRDVTVEDVSAVYPFYSAAEYFEHVSQVTPPLIALLKQLDEAQIAELYREIERVVTERFTSDDGTIRIPNRAIVVGATAPG
jgi:ubiquinone/menaquinone biosynthesis C-methylase UbiE